MPAPNVYPFSTTASGWIYTFESIGKKRLTKKVIFTQMANRYFNVELRTEVNGLLLPDTEVSNNGDAYTVLATVAGIIEKFLATHPDTIIHIKGSDDRRQKIYQGMLMEAARAKKAIQAFGVHESGDFEPLKEGILYDACFVVRLKEPNFNA